MNIEYIYLFMHGLATIGTLLGFMVRLEHRLTRTETRLDLIEQEHQQITGPRTHSAIGNKYADHNHI